MTTTIPKNIRQEFEKKIRRGIFNPVARFLHENIREERMQEALGFTWALYKRHAEAGDILDDALLVHACRLRAIDLSRHLASGDRTQRLKDVFDQRNYNRRRVEVLGLGEYVVEFEDNPQIDNVESNADVGRARAYSLNPTGRIISAISLNEWLATLAPRDRLLIELRAAGHDLDEIGSVLGMDRVAVCRRVKALGELLAEHAGMPAAVHRRQLKRAKASEEPAPESGVRAKTRGRPRKTPAPVSTKRDRPSRWARRAA
ncbi:hypothetical protein [Polyangium spumosum]|uniref:Uncharacterized protein n=1 Tax=Polyangium spumosum TaxID=889282 RepID=A0A6N7PR22_9BACT|nr:hypothetical protein [Polyangium spumosum]MRG94632.1 hypothetical protein [Polyangium spumosum]